MVVLLAQAAGLLRACWQGGSRKQEALLLPPAWSWQLDQQLPVLQACSVREEVRQYRKGDWQLFRSVFRLTGGTMKLGHPVIGKTAGDLLKQLPRSTK